MKELKLWKTLDGRIIPIKYMTTTHLANSMHMLFKNNMPYPDLLEEWTLREKEGIWSKIRRGIARWRGNYYKGTPKYLKPAFVSSHIQDELDLTGDM